MKGTARSLLLGSILVGAFAFSACSDDTDEPVGGSGGSDVGTGGKAAGGKAAGGKPGTGGKAAGGAGVGGAGVGGAAVGGAGVGGAAVGGAGVGGAGVGGNTVTAGAGGASAGTGNVTSNAGKGGGVAGGPGAGAPNTGGAAAGGPSAGAPSTGGAAAGGPSAGAPSTGGMTNVAGNAGAPSTGGTTNVAGSGGVAGGDSPGAAGSAGQGTAGTAGAGATYATLVNPGFEEAIPTGGDIPGWTTTGTAGATNLGNWTHSGSKMLAYWLGAPYAVETSQTLTPIANGTYQLGVWVAQGAGSTTGANLQAYIFARNCGGSDVQAATTAATSSGFSQITVNVNVTSNTCTVGFSVTGTAGGEWADFDDVTFTLQ